MTDRWHGPRETQLPWLPCTCPSCIRERARQVLPDCCEPVIYGHEPGCACSTCVTYRAWLAEGLRRTGGITLPPVLRPGETRLVLRGCAPGPVTWQDQLNLQAGIAREQAELAALKDAEEKLRASEEKLVLVRQGQAAGCTCNAPYSGDPRARPESCPARKRLDAARFAASSEPEFPPGQPDDPVAAILAALGEPLGLDWAGLTRLAPYARSGTCAGCHTPLLRAGPPPWNARCTWCAELASLQDAAAARDDARYRDQDLRRTGQFLLAACGLTALVLVTILLVLRGVLPPW